MHITSQSSNKIFPRTPLGVVIAMVLAVQSCTMGQAPAYVEKEHQSAKNKQLPARLRDPAYSPQGWGLMLHDDGDSIFMPQHRIYSADCSSQPAGTIQEDAEIHKQYLLCRYSNFWDIGIDTLKINVYSGISYFEPASASFAITSDDEQPNELPDNPKARSLNARMNLTQVLYGKYSKYDPIATALSSFRGRGGKTVVSFRISDSHYLQTKTTLSTPSQMTPKILLEKPFLVIGESHLPAGVEARLGGLLDFGQEDVRGAFIKVIRSALSKYGKLIDGIEIDFTRNPILFRDDKAKDNANLVNGLLLSIRDSSKDYGKLAILARVPINLRKNLERGLDVKYWLDNKLVDVIIPSDLMSLYADSAIEPLISIAKRNGVLVYQGMPSRRSVSLWRFNPDTQSSEAVAESAQNRLACDAKCFKKNLLAYKLPSPDYLLGAAFNAKSKGADGVELYNFAAETFRTDPWYFQAIIPGLEGRLSKGALTFGSAHNTPDPMQQEQEEIPTLPVSLDGHQKTEFRILVGSHQPSYTGGLLKLELLDKSKADCKAWHKSSPVPLVVSKKIPTPYSNKEATHQDTLRSKAVDPKGTYFPEIALVFPLEVSQIGNGYNTFSISCPQDNVLMNAEITLYR